MSSFPKLARAPACIAFAILALAQPLGATAPAEAVDRLLEVSGTNERLARFGAAIGAQFIPKIQSQLRQMPLASDDLAELPTIVDRLYAFEALRDVLAGRLAASLSAADVDQLIEVYSSPFGRRIVRADREHDLNTNPAGFQRFLLSLDNDPASDARLAFGERLEALFDSSARIAAVSIDTEVALIEGIAETDPGSALPAAADYRAVLEAQYAPSVGQRRQMMALSHAWSYEAFSVDELTQLETILSSPAMRRFNAAQADGLGDALVVSSRTLGEHLGARLDSSRRTSGL